MDRRDKPGGDDFKCWRRNPTISPGQTTSPRVTIGCAAGYFTIRSTLTSLMP